MQSWHIRQAAEADRPFLERLAPRLSLGVAPWRGAERMRATMLRFLLDDLAAMGRDSTVFIAEAADGTPVGAATIGRSNHFTGQEQAELGELAVVEEAEGQGAGTALLAAAEAWARERGFPFVALGTGVANARARAFYARHGYAEEDVRLIKPLRSPRPF
jgi:GNAT superfamily N-acetyltransferase